MLLLAVDVMFTINIKLTSCIPFSPFTCRHKRKVQNFLPCKTPTRGPLDPSVMPVGHSQYEDPDLHHRPLVMRQHPLNVEVRTGFSDIRVDWGLGNIWQSLRSTRLKPNLFNAIKRN